MSIDYTILVNRDHPVPDNFIDQITLVELLVSKDFIVPMESETVNAYLKLQKCLNDEGLRNLPLSAYRTIKSQERVWNTSLQKYGLEYTIKYVAKPGYSEHHTGLAIDLTLYDKHLDSVEDLYAPEYALLASHLHEFGFILRYPEYKEAITGQSFEPWHIRYVGFPAATIIHENHWTLEEYVEQRQSAGNELPQIR